MNIVNVPLSEIEEAPFNYNLHPQNQIDELRGSLEEFGQFKNIVLWNGYCIAGNGLTFAARSMGWASLKAIIRNDLTEEQAKRLCIADNATPYLAQPDADKLEDLLKSLPSLDDIPGVNKDWLNTLDLSFDGLFDMPNADIDDPAADEVPEAKESITKLGDLWQLGEHRLLCGDATITNEKKILGRKTASFVFGELSSDDFIDEFSPTLPKTCTPPKKNVVMYSGGKDSLAMLLTMKKHNIPIHHIISFHAGSWEWDTLEQHHKDVERYFDVKIEWIQGGDAIEKGFKKYGFPQLFARWCNTIKVKMLKKYVKEQFGGEENIMQFVGIAYSERERLMADHYRKFHYRFPLIEYKITEDEALDLCQKEGFTFGGIYEKQHRLSCWCCPMTRDAYIFDIIQDHKRLDILRKMQKQSPTPFKLPHKTIYWFEHEYWSRYGRNGESKTVDVFSRNDKSDEAILQKTQEYITKKTQERDIILCFDGNSHDVFWACIATNRLFYGIESSPKYCDFLVNTWEQYTGKQATLAD